MQVAQRIDGAIHDHPDLVPEIQMLYDRAGIELPTSAAPKTGGGTSIFSVCIPWHCCGSVSNGGCAVRGELCEAIRARQPCISSVCDAFLAA